MKDQFETSASNFKANCLAWPVGIFLFAVFGLNGCTVYQNEGRTAIEEKGDQLEKTAGGLVNPGELNWLKVRCPDQPTSNSTKACSALRPFQLQ